MPHGKPIVVYGASGYTGRLTCEALASRGIAFVAAGRNQQRLDAAIAPLVADGADAVASAIEHTPAALQQLFRGARVVINISGPFSKLGRAVVGAALHAGCHYLDSTGEQDFMLAMRAEFGNAYAAAGLVLSPSCAFLWSPGVCAAEVCLETAGIDSIKTIYAPPSLQTTASLQSMVRTARRDCYALLDRELTLETATGARRVMVPGTGELRGALAIGGGETTFFLGDDRVRNCETLFASDELAKIARAKRLWRQLARVAPADALDKLSDRIVATFKKEPPREIEETSRFVVAAFGEGNNVRSSCILYGTGPYLITGFLGAEAATRLLADRIERRGYVSLAQAFGARSILTSMEAGGTVAIIDAPAPPGSVLVPQLALRPAQAGA